MNLVDQIAEERLRVADVAASLTPTQYDVQSLCGAWSVREVLAHLLMPLVTPLPVIVLAMARNGFDFDKANAALATRTATSVPDLVAGLRAQANHPFKPPGLSHVAPLSDVLIHTQDVVRPLGLDVQPPTEKVVTSLQFVTGSKRAAAFANPRLQKGLRFTATDSAWASGEGPEIRGPGIDLLLALTGRPVAASLEGDGLAVFEERRG